MPVLDFVTDLDSLTVTITAQFAAAVERVWQVYADPRQLEQVWGPPDYPATVVDHALEPGGRVTYFMTGPEGDRFAGFWDVTAVTEPTGFAFADGFADAEFQVVPGMPVSRNTFSFEDRDGGTRATYVSSYPDAVSLQKVLELGMQEGATSAIAQIDTLLGRG